MGNINSHNPYTDSIRPNQPDREDFNDGIPSPKLRYIQILLKQGQLGNTFPRIIENCIRAAGMQEASVEYIQAVLGYVLDQKQKKKIGELEGGWAILKVVRVAGWHNMVRLTGEDKIALDVIREDAIQQLAMRA
jgi:hypothetical protein